MPSPLLPSEADEGKMLVAYLRLKGYKFTHIANESGSSRRDAMIRGGRMKAQGVSRGFPDYGIIVGHFLLFIELKRRKGSKTSPEQHEWIESLDNISPSVRARVCHGYDECVAFIEEFAAAGART